GEELLFAHMGVQRFALWGASVNRWIRLSPTDIGDMTNPDDYSWTHKKISFLYWPMVSPYSWYFLSLKVAGRSPRMMTIPEQPSYAEFHYLYFDKVDIKSNSNPDVKILSATSQLGNSNDVEIIFEGMGATDLIIQMSDTSITYTATLNNAEASIIQKNGELFFDDLHVDSENSECVLSISKSNKNINDKQTTHRMLLELFEKFPLFQSFLKIL
ncbi:unnamed protein product, partial [marine sediment metagenome]